VAQSALSEGGAAGAVLTIAQSMARLEAASPFLMLTVQAETDPAAANRTATRDKDFTD